MSSAAAAVIAATTTTRQSEPGPSNQRRQQQQEQRPWVEKWPDIALILPNTGSMGRDMVLIFFYFLRAYNPY